MFYISILQKMISLTYPFLNLPEGVALLKVQGKFGHVL